MNFQTIEKISHNLRQAFVSLSTRKAFRSTYRYVQQADSSTMGTPNGFAVPYLQKKYYKQREILNGKSLPVDVDSAEVFANNELNLQEVKIYGFDYDYTIARYDISVEYLIHHLGKTNLIRYLKYPVDLEKLTYNPNYAIRGLHYDIEQGHLMKLDQFQQIQLSSIYKGLTHLEREDVVRCYGSRALPLDYVEGHLHGKAKMAHLADIFSKPEMCLLRQIAHYFMEHKLPYHSVSLFNDVKAAMSSILPEMHRVVGTNMDKYLIKDENLVTYLHHLKQKGMKTFIITNSPFHFIEAGLTFLFGKDWQDLFDVVIAGAKKPDFFVDTMRPFREFDKGLHRKCWETVAVLEKGKVYLEGNLTSLQKLQQWKPQEILYFGDHPYSDLADLTLHHLWRTGAIIWELEHEIGVINTTEYKKTLGWMRMLNNLIEEHQDCRDMGAKAIIQDWIQERNFLREEAKKMFNPHFGSVFRAFDNPSYFSRRLFRFADIYTSKLSNLSNYSSKHIFYPRKGVLPHEYKSLFV